MRPVPLRTGRFPLEKKLTDHSAFGQHQLENVLKPLIG
jgi:hypothetical protein